MFCGISFAKVMCVKSKTVELATNNWVRHHLLLLTEDPLPLPINLKEYFQCHGCNVAMRYCWSRGWDHLFWNCELNTQWTTQCPLLVYLLEIMYPFCHVYRTCARLFIWSKINHCSADHCLPWTPTHPVKITKGKKNIYIYPSPSLQI